MLRPETLQWRDEFVLTREIEIPGDRTIFFARVRAGEFVRVRRGVYMATDRWCSLGSQDRYRMIVLATVAYAGYPVVLSHESAASLWRLPWVGPSTGQVHAVGDSLGGSSRSLFRRHSPRGDDDPVRIDGVDVTSLSRTVVDIARTSSFEQSVVAADAALRRNEHPHPVVPQATLTKQQLLDELGSTRANQGEARARLALHFADGRADRPGESLSRANIRRARLTAPELQVPMTGASGRNWIVDFWWPDFNLIGEFDGAAKYSDVEFLRGRTPHQALIEEKFREDDLRATGRRMTRWMWQTAVDLEALRGHLIAAGVR